MHEKIVALSDVSMYTNDGDIPLKEVFKKIKEKENSKPVLLNSKSSSKELFSFLIEVLPEYNKESVYASDVKKLISWYNILIEKGIDFETEESKTEENELEEHAENESEL
jgi:hypothetical protein